MLPHTALDPPKENLNWVEKRAVCRQENGNDASPAELQRNARVRMDSSAIHNPNRVLARIHSALSRFGEVNASIEELVTTEGSFSHKDVYHSEGVDHDQEGHPRNTLELALDWQTLSQDTVTARSQHATVVKGHFAQEEDVVLAPIQAVELVGKPDDVELFDLDGAPFQSLVPCNR